MTLKHPIWSYVFLISAFNCLIRPSFSCAAEEASTPFPGVRYVHEVRPDPKPGVSLHIITVDLTNPGVSLRVVPAGPDPDGSGKWQTSLLPVPEIAKREGFDLAINGDYFEVEQAPAGGAGGDDLAALVQRGYRKGQPAKVMGVAVTDGKPWSTSAVERPTLMVDDKGRVRIERATKAPAGVRQAIAGLFLVENGRPVESPVKERNAWTAVGLDRAGTTLTILVVDGLWERKASGMPMPELLKEMVRLGCYQALSLDGGGSTTLVMRDPAGGEKYQVVNHPTDGKPRPVASVLGIRVKRAE